MSSPQTQLAQLRAVFFSWRTGPFLWSASLGVAFYLILVFLHGAGALIPARVLNALELYAKVLTVLSSIAFSVQALTMLAYINLNDEFMRSLVFKRMALAALVAILIATIWSLLADMAWAPAFEPINLYLLFLGVSVAIMPFMNAERP